MPEKEIIGYSFRVNLPVQGNELTVYLQEEEDEVNEQACSSCLDKSAENVLSINIKIVEIIDENGVTISPGSDYHRIVEDRINSLEFFGKVYCSECYVNFIASNWMAKLEVEEKDPEQ